MKHPRCQNNAFIWWIKYPRPQSACKSFSSSSRFTEFRVILTVKLLHPSYRKTKIVSAGLFKGLQCLALGLVGGFLWGNPWIKHSSTQKLNQHCAWMPLNIPPSFFAGCIIRIKCSVARALTFSLFFCLFCFFFLCVFVVALAPFRLLERRRKFSAPQSREPWILLK